MAKQLSLDEVVIVSAVRTPIGSFKGSLSSLSATQLGAIAIKAAVERAGIPKDEVKEVIMGNVCSGYLGQNPARQAAIFGGLTSSTVCTTLNRMSTSGIKAVILALQGILTGTQDVILAGGMESLSNVPYYLKRGELPYGGIELIDGVLYDGITDVYDKCHVGYFLENIAKNMSISRYQQDEYAIKSYRNSAAAYKMKAFQDELVSVSVPQKRGAPPIIISEDEEFQRVNFEKLDKLAPVFQKENSTLTAGNICKLNDGAAALILMTADTARRLDVKPLARVLGYAEGGCDPAEFGISPSIVIPELLKKTCVSKDDIALWEINETASVVVIVNQKILNLNPAKINVHGGAVSLGHPFGMTGARLVGHLCYALQKGEKGVAVSCGAGGCASSIMLEKL